MGQFYHWATRCRRLVAGTHQPKFVWSCGAFNPHIDFAAERPEIDRLSQKRLGAVLQRLALRLRIAISSDHDDWNIRPHGLRLGQELKTAHPRHVDVGQDQDD